MKPEGFTLMREAVGGDAEPLVLAADGVTLRAERGSGHANAAEARRRRVWFPLVERTGREIVTTREDREIDQHVTLTLPSSWLSTLDLTRDAAKHLTLVALAKWALGIRSFFFLDPTKLRASSRSKNGEVGEHGETRRRQQARRRPLWRPALSAPSFNE